MKCNIIGAGRLGKNIALALTTAKIISSLNICNRSQESAELACQEIGCGLAVAEIRQLPAADITWICSNDDAIPLIVDELAQHALVKPDSFVIHSSGALNSTVLMPLQELGGAIASFHPLKAFKTHYLSADAFQQVDCVLEGDEAVCAWLSRSFAALNAYLSVINPEAKAMYHAAACIASNYLITLASCSESLFLKAGLEPQQSRRMLLNLMQGNLNNLQQSDAIAKSLTGPLLRGDIATLDLHLHSIENPDILRLYKAAGLATIPLTPLTKTQQEQIRNLLADK